MSWQVTEGSCFHRVLHDIFLFWHMFSGTENHRSSQGVHGIPILLIAFLLK